MIAFYLNALATITGYFVWFCIIITIIFSLIFNKISDKEREKREHNRVEFYEDTDSVSCRQPVRIIRGRGGPH